MQQLQHIFELQQALNARLIEQRNLQGQPKEVWLQRQTLAMVSELAELLDEVNFKWWKNPAPIDDDRLRDELVDIFHFFVSMCLTAGMDADELYSRYCQKNQENHARQDGTSAKTGYKIEQG